MFDLHELDGVSSSSHSFTSFSHSVFIRSLLPLGPYSVCFLLWFVGPSSVLLSSCCAATVLPGNLIGLVAPALCLVLKTNWTGLCGADGNWSTIVSKLLKKECNFLVQSPDTAPRFLLPICGTPCTDTYFFWFHVYIAPNHPGASLTNPECSRCMPSECNKYIAYTTTHHLKLTHDGVTLSSRFITGFGDVSLSRYHSCCTLIQRMSPCQGSRPPLFRFHFRFHLYCFVCGHPPYFKLQLTPPVFLSLSCKNLLFRMQNHVKTQCYIICIVVLVLVFGCWIFTRFLTCLSQRSIERLIR